MDCLNRLVLSCLSGLGIVVIMGWILGGFPIIWFSSLRAIFGAILLTLLASGVSYNLLSGR